MHHLSSLGFISHHVVIFLLITIIIVVVVLFYFVSIKKLFLSQPMSFTFFNSPPHPSRARGEGNEQELSSHLGLNYNHAPTDTIP